MGFGEKQAGDREFDAYAVISVIHNISDSELEEEATKENPKVIHQKNNQRKSRKKILLIIVIAVVISIISLMGLIISATFESDYRPGTENAFGNSQYINNGGYVCLQDEMYYIGGQNGIYKTKNFEKFTKIYKNPAYSINVIGDWIYFGSNNNLMKLRTDGKQEEILKTHTRAEDGFGLILADSYHLYYVRSDHKLYRFPINGSSKEIKLSNDTIGNFAFDGANILYVKSKISKTKGDGLMAEGRALKTMFNDGSDPSTFIKWHEYDPNKEEFPIIIPWDICQYNNRYYYIDPVKNDLFEIRYSADTKRLNVKGGMQQGHSLSIVDGYAYYSVDKENALGKVYRVSLSTLKNQYLGKPFDNEYQVHYLYPVKKNSILLSLDTKKWYLWDYKKNYTRALMLEE